MTPPEDAIPEDAELPIGQVIAGNFRIERLLGSGAMGHVYQAEQLSLGKAVAVKVLHPHLAKDPKLVRRFQREAKSASRLNHANSIQIIDSGQDASGTLYIAMELLSGRDLAQVIRDEFPLPLPRIVRIMSQVLSALDEAHAHGVIHRDLKPSNIMLTERRGQPDFVKVCDYGIAKAQVEDEQTEAQMLTVQGLVCGTPEYMSPEQARGEPLDGRADLYSAAVILYHMVTGDIPFRAATPIGIVSRHLSEAPALPSTRRPDPSVPADLDDLIMRALAKSRELRPPTALVFREELESIGSNRVGRRARSADSTIPANQPISGVAITAQVPAATGATPVPAAPARHRGPWALGLVVAAGVVAAAMVIQRSRLNQSNAGAPAPSTSPVMAAGIAPERNAPVPAPPGSPPATLPPVSASAPGAATSAASSPIARSDAVAGAVRERTPDRRRREGGGRLVPPPPRRAPATATAGIVAAPAGASGPVHAAHAAAGAPGPGGTVGATAGASDEGHPAPARGARELVAEAEKFLAQGEVGQACGRGEEAKRVAPRLAPVYKFLGKCYMRAGNPQHAKENYRRYLELNPGAPDAMFIESIVK